MTPNSGTEFTGEMIQVLIKIQEEMLNSGLSNKQKDDIKKLKLQLDALDLQTDETNIKLQLIDVMNRLLRRTFEKSIRYQSGGI
jgi:hypothetical protein